MPANSALRLRAVLDFEDQDGTKRVAGDEWLFEGPGMKLILVITFKNKNCIITFKNKDCIKYPIPSSLTLHYVIATVHFQCEWGPGIIHWNYF